MKKIRLLILVLFIGAFSVTAQKKKELLNNIENLREEVKSLNFELTRLKQREQLTAKKLENATKQNVTVEQEKQQLLKTISGFTSVSKQKAENLTSSLETIKQKDRQLKIINDALAAAENNKLQQLTTVRDSLGTIGKIGFKNDVLILEIPNTDLFGNDDKAVNTTLLGEKAIEKIGAFLNHYPKYTISIEGNSNALTFDEKENYLKDNWDLSALQATAIARTLQANCNINPNRIEVAAKSEYNTKGIETKTCIIFKPTFDAFFELVKETMK